VPVNDFDKACRRMVKEAPLSFLVWLFVDFETVAKWLDWVDTRRLAFPGNPDQTGDIVFKLEALKVVGPPWAVALEFQIEPDPNMHGWLLQFLGTIFNERRPDEEKSSRYQLGAVVINLTGTTASLPASASFSWPGQPEMLCALKALERYLAMESAEEALAAITSGRYDRPLLPWIPLMKGGSEPDVIKRWKELASEEPDARKRAELGYNALVFAEKSANRGAWLEALEGWEMVKSETMEKSRAEGRHGVVLKVVSECAKGEIPADLIAKIRACSDEDRLAAWAIAAARASSLDAFLQETGL
jgi:hypothetical protein